MWSYAQFLTDSSTAQHVPAERALCGTWNMLTLHWGMKSNVTRPLEVREGVIQHCCVTRYPLSCVQEKTPDHARLPTVNWLGVVSLRVVEPIRPLLHLHPPCAGWCRVSPTSPLPSTEHPHTAAGDGEMTVWVVVQSGGQRCWRCCVAVFNLDGSLLAPPSHAQT